MRDSSYHHALAQILRKAQGVVSAETGREVDVGAEVLALRKICDSLTRELTELIAEWNQPVLKSEWQKKCAEVKRETARADAMERAGAEQSRRADENLAVIQSLRAEVAVLLTLLATERGCSECWRGSVCGSDCHMADVAALAAGRAQ